MSEVQVSWGVEDQAKSRALMQVFAAGTSNNIVLPAREAASFLFQACFSVEQVLWGMISKLDFSLGLTVASAPYPRICARNEAGLQARYPSIAGNIPLVRGLYFGAQRLAREIYLGGRATTEAANYYPPQPSEVNAIPLAVWAGLTLVSAAAVWAGAWYGKEKEKLNVQLQTDRAVLLAKTGLASEAIAQKVAAGQSVDIGQILGQDLLGQLNRKAAEELEGWKTAAVVAGALLIGGSVVAKLV